MSHLRREPAKRLRDEAGRVVCSCGCGRYPAPPRRYWFSQACVDGWLVRNQPQYVRRAVFKRDRGVCAACGLDTEALRRQRYSYRPRPHNAHKNWPSDPATWWQADHIVPVVEGGGQCGLDNYRTLCVPCHKRETAALRKRMARRTEPMAA